MLHSKSIVKSLFVVVGIWGSCISGATGQEMRVTISDGEGGSGGFASSNVPDNSRYDQQRLDHANNMNRYEGYQIQVSRFNQQLLISLNTVHSINVAISGSSKYLYAQSLYKKSLAMYKKLEALSAAAAQNVKLGKDIQAFQTQQDQIVDAAVDDFHKAQYVQEMGDTRNQIIQAAKDQFILENCLSKEEMSQLAVLKVQIKDAQNEIAQLHQSGQSMDRMRDQLNNDYHVLIQSVTSLARISEDAMKIFVPNEKVVKGIDVAQKMINTWVDEAYNQGKSPQDAALKAIEEGYKEMKKESQDEKKTPSEKKVEAIKAIFEGVEREADNWEKMDKDRSQAIRGINEAVDFTNDQIRRNQQLANVAATKGEKLTQRCFDAYAKRIRP